MITNLSSHLRRGFKYSDIPAFYTAAPKKKQESAKNEGAESSREAKERQANLEKFMMTAQKARKLKIKFSEEEAQEHFRIGKEYNRQCRIRSNQLNKEYATKCWLLNEAVKALPEHLRAHATTVDETPPPEGRQLPIFDTPPIKGFKVSDYLKKGDDEEDEDDYPAINFDDDDDKDDDDY